MNPETEKRLAERLGFIVTVDGIRFYGEEMSVTRAVKRLWQLAGELMEKVERMQLCLERIAKHSEDLLVRFDAASELLPPAPEGE